MNDIMKHLDLAYAHLSKIPVLGEAVDAMALARQEMRTAYRVAKAVTEQETETDG